MGDSSTTGRNEPIALNRENGFTDVATKNNNIHFPEIGFKPPNRDRRIKSFPDNTITRLVLRDARANPNKGRSGSLGNHGNSLVFSPSSPISPGPTKRKWSTGFELARAVSISRRIDEGKMDWNRAHNRMVLANTFTHAVNNSPLTTTALEKRRVSKEAIRIQNKKKLIRKFRLAVKLCIYCIRLIKAHSLRNKEHDDEISPFIKGLNFYEEEPVDLMFAKNDYKANRSMRVPEETKRILCKRPSNRTEHELYSVQIALRNIKAIAEYPQNMQRKIAEVGQYERYEAKRILLRQGHPASAYYFVLSGQAVVMVMDATRTFARPALYYNKGGEFGELAIIQGTKRNATIICKEPCELLSISKKDYKRIFMMGGEKSIGDPDQEEFIRSLNFLDGWPLSKLKEHPDKTKFLYFKRGDIVAQETMFYDWLIIVKTGSIRVLKKLKKVRPYEWKKKRTTVQFVPEKTKRANIENRETFRRHVLSELRIPLRNIEEEDSYMEEYPGKPKAFQHPSNSPSSIDHCKSHKLPEIRRPGSRNGKRKRNGFQNIQGQFLPRLSEEGTLNQNTIDKDDVQMESYPYRGLSRKLEIEGGLVLSTTSSEKRRPSLMEREKELMGFKEHKRTIQEDIDGIKRKDPLDVTEADLRPEFVEIQILSKGQVFGLPDIILDQQPNFCIVSNGADLILIDKEFYLQHASGNLKNRMRQDLCPYPTDEEMQERLQRSVDWSAFRTTTMSDTLDFLKAKRELRASLTI